MAVNIVQCSRQSEAAGTNGVVSKDNVLPFTRANHRESISGKFVRPEDVKQLGSLMSDDDGNLSVVLIRPPAGTVGWEIDDADEARALGVYMIELAARMRRGGDDDR